MSITSTPGNADAYQEVLRDLMFFLDFAATVLSLFPAFRDAVTAGAWIPAAKRPRRVPAEQAQAHNLVWSPRRRRHICRWCARSTRTPGMPGRCAAPRLAQFARFAANAGPNHHLFSLSPDRALPDGDPDCILFCNKCGAYSTAKLVGLAGPCAGRPLYGPSRTRLKHMRNGVHPTKRWTGFSFPFPYAMGEQPAPLLEVVPAAPAVAVPPVAPSIDAAADEDDPAFMPFGDIHATDMVDAHAAEDAAWLGVFEPM